LAQGPMAAPCRHSRFFPHPLQGLKPMRISLQYISLGLLLGVAVPELGAQAKRVANPAASAAQPSDADIQREMDAVRAEVRTNRKKIVAGGMDLTTEENQKFWPLYAEYRDSSSKQGERLTAIITEYARNYDTLTDQQATKLIYDYAKLDQDRINLRGTYVKKFGAFLPPKKLMRYFQIENKLDAIMNYDLAGAIPLPN
jgi:hypothetical protein